MPVVLPISTIQCDLPPESATGFGEPLKLAPPAAQPPCELELLKLAARRRDYLLTPQLLAFAICGETGFIKLIAVRAIMVLKKTIFVTRSEK